ncbi:hypothetical protein L6164_016567 [Bauhinia variegata]|uniref:Uncharacterized protein n=1 Tax=Bauhinia variegata TaxID=167791 RepID=A0ACB9NQ49_BAUVA|nr:hypothetical protein L6164_016567 [Bauhinia variegata]
MKEGSSHCWGWCSTSKGYSLCKQLSKITETMKSQSQKGEFNPFSLPAPIADIEFFSSGNFIFFESTKLAFEQLLTALQDDSVCMIGLLGMGGYGKTSLEKELNLEDLGILLHNNHKGCKGLLTTHRKRTHFSMDCERMNSLTELSNKDAWTLFQKHTHVVDESSLNVAREVVGECKGLPIATVAVARASKGRSSDW